MADFNPTLLDENTIVVAYDYKRGEKRAPLQRDQTCGTTREATARRLRQLPPCVAVCPTGIDIRNGTQMECVNCTACIDACDNIMDKIGRPRGLIRYASLNSIERGERFRFTPRLMGYSVLLVALRRCGWSSSSRGRKLKPRCCARPAHCFRSRQTVHFSNLYTVKVVNKTSREVPIQLKLENIDGDLQIMGENIVVPPEKLVENSILIVLDKSVLKSGTTPVAVGVYSHGKHIQRIKTSFIGPRNDSHHDD